jgi:hypothetical protein
MMITCQTEPVLRARKFVIAASLILLGLTSCPAIASQTEKIDPVDKQIKTLNNDGVRALRDHSPNVALKLFCQATMLAPRNPVTRQNLDEAIRLLGKNPQKFNDRVELGDAAAGAKDFAGAIVEYKAAIELHEDPRVHVKLGDVYRILSEQQQDELLKSAYRGRAFEQYAGGLYGPELKQKLRLLESPDTSLPEPAKTPREANTFNKQQLALVAVPTLVTIFAFAGRKKRTSIWMIGLFIAGIFALTGFLSFS